MTVDSEFSCEVVSITSVIPHPNADRLELIQFRFKDGPSSIVVVSGKGLWNTGDLAVYISPDSMLPLAEPRWDFLRTSSYPSKLLHRLRSARLRGVYSEGIITAVPGSCGIGDNMAVALRIDPYKSPADYTREQHEARTEFGRKNKGLAKYRIPEYSLVSLKKAAYHIKKGEPVVVTEKVHGTNFRFGLVPRSGWLGSIGRLLRFGKLGYEFVVGSHRVIKRPDSSPGFYGADIWNDAARVHGLEKKMRDAGQFGIVWYGEIYGVTDRGSKVQDMTYGNTSNGLVIFDCYHYEKQEYIPRDEWLSLSPVGTSAPVLFRREYSEDDIRVRAEGMTRVGSDTKQIMEGVVVETLTRPIRKGKWVSESYKLRKDD
jgi:RNA ligase (TIGR02306 family)